MGRNQVSLLLDLYAYQLMHSLRVLMQYITYQGWSLRKVREQILKVAATVTVHARHIRVHIGQTCSGIYPGCILHRHKYRFLPESLRNQPCAEGYARLCAEKSSE